MKCGIAGRQYGAVGTHAELAAKLGIRDVEADVLPERKSAIVEKYRKDGRVVAMAGDGINDAPALAAALRRLIDDASLRTAFGRTGRRRVEQHFSVAAVTPQVEAVYERLISRRRLAA